MGARPFKIGEWVVHPDLNRIEGSRRSVLLEPKAMDLLVVLARRAGEVVTQEELRERVWTGTFVAGNAVFRLVSELRRQLEDSPREPRYIQTIPKRGYRLVAEVSEIRGIGGTQRLAMAAALAVAALAAVIWGGTHRSPEPNVRASAAPPESYAIGEVLEDRVDCSAYDRARVEFEDALRTNQGYRPTYGHLTDSYLAAAVLGCIPVAPARTRVDELVAMTGRWDSERQRLRHQAAVQFWLHWDLQTAGELFRQVEDLPDVSRAAFLLRLGRPGQAVAEAERAWNTDPAQLGESWTLATMRLFVGEYSEAAVRYRQLLSVYPDYPPALALSALASLLEGRWDEALSVARRAGSAERWPRDRFSAVPALVLAKLGRQSEAVALLERWDVSARQAPWVAPTASATAALARGRKEQALRALEEGVRIRDPWLIVVAMDPTFAELRSEGRFEALLRR